ncbi:MAG: hypothetical protein ABI898_13680 [Sphingomonadales bacterium]
MKITLLTCAALAAVLMPAAALADNPNDPSMRMPRRRRATGRRRVSSISTRSFASARAMRAGLKGGARRAIPTAARTPNTRPGRRIIAAP